MGEANLKKGMKMTEQKELTNFEKLFEKNVSKYVEKKNGLSYLSWTYAWATFKQAYPKATYSIRHWDGCPYWYDPVLGYIVETSINSGEEELSMWLPVMDGANKAMKDKPYTYKVKKYEYDPVTKKQKWTGEYEEKTVEAATMFDINTAIMRCLVKNTAMFGLGLYIYAGEDLPQDSESTIENKENAHKILVIKTMKDKIKGLLEKLDPKTDASAFVNFESIEDEETLKNMGIALKKLIEQGQ